MNGTRSDENDDSRPMVIPAAPAGMGSPAGVMPIPTAPISPGVMVASPSDMTMFDAWNFRPEVVPGPKGLAGYAVEASDGRIGKVDRASHDLDDGYLIVDIGLIFGRTVVVPAGTVNHIDTASEVVYLDCSKAEMKDSPEIDVHGPIGSADRDRIVEHFGRGTEPKKEHLGRGAEAKK
jgi:hypothetical protein